MESKKYHLVVAGAQKSGTTWIHDTLEYQDEFWCPPRRQEIHFFDRFYDRGYAWYKSIYENAGIDKITVDVSPDYLCHPLAPKRIKALESEYDRELKILISLRNPITRAISAYKMKVRNGAYNFALSRALKVDTSLIGKSKYKTPLINFKSSFDHDNIKVSIMEEIFDDSNSFLNELKEFVEAENDLLNPYEEVRVNSSSEGKSYYSARVISMILRCLGLERMVHEVKRSRWAQYLRQDAYQVHEPVVDDHGVQLLHEELSDEAREVTDLIGRQDVLDIWNLS